MSLRIFSFFISLHVLTFWHSFILRLLSIFSRRAECLSHFPDFFPALVKFCSFWCQSISLQFSDPIDDSKACGL